MKTTARIVSVRLSDGKISDVTEGVQVLYDLLFSSLDWGSGFLSAEDIKPIARLADATGFCPPENKDGKWIEAEKQIAAEAAVLADEVKTNETIQEVTQLRTKVEELETWKNFQLARNTLGTGLVELNVADLVGADAGMTCQLLDARSGALVSPGVVYRDRDGKLKMRVALYRDS